MRLHLLSSTAVAFAVAAAAAATAMTPSPSPKPKRPSSSNPNPNPSLCKHSPSATLDLLILILVLFSGSFLLTSYLSYLFHSFSLLLPSLIVSSSSRDSSLPYILGFLISFTIVIVSIEMICCGYRSRKCDNPGCKGLKKSMEFDLQLQTEDCVRSASSKEIDRLPWKGGSEGNPDYECLRMELRKMAPPNGRAVLLFRSRCGCPTAKLEGWGPKRGRRHKKSVIFIAFISILPALLFL